MPGDALLSMWPCSAGPAVSDPATRGSAGPDLASRHSQTDLLSVADFLEEAAALERGLAARLCPAGKGGALVHQSGGAARCLSKASISATCTFSGLSSWWV